MHDSSHQSRYVTRAPEFRPPNLSCDTHCHIFGPSGRFPWTADRRYTPEDAPKEELGRLHAALGIDRAVIVQATCYGSDNRAMLDAIAWGGGRYRGVALIDGSESDSSATWNAMVAPRNTPKAIIDKINADVNEALRQPEVIERYRKLSAELVGGSPEAAAAYIREETERWRTLIKSAGIKLE